AQDFVEPGDAVGEDAGLVGAGTGQHEVMARRRRDGLALGAVEAVEKVGDIHARILRGSGTQAVRRELVPGSPGRRRSMETQSWRAFAGSPGHMNGEGPHCGGPPVFLLARVTGGRGSVAGLLALVAGV